MATQPKALRLAELCKEGGALCKEAAADDVAGLLALLEVEDDDVCAGEEDRE